MDRVEFLLGRWEGTGWHRHGGSPPVRFRQSEHVRRRLDGELVTIEGRGWRDDGAGDVVHRAFALVSYDSDRECYRWEAFSRGGRVETVVDLSDGGFAWSLSPAPDVTIHYRGLVTHDTWTETAQLHAGEGLEPATVLEMTLRRVG
jgi:hypothetical protein